jgi:hypothetical protein
MDAKGERCATFKRPRSISIASNDLRADDGFLTDTCVARFFELLLRNYSPCRRVESIAVGIKRGRRP